MLDLRLGSALLFPFRVDPVCGSCPLQGQLYVQFSELFQEAAVWKNAPVFQHLLNGINHSHVLVNHQISQDQGC